MNQQPKNDLLSKTRRYLLHIHLILHFNSFETQGNTVLFVYLHSILFCTNFYHTLVFSCSLITVGFFSSNFQQLSMTTCLSCSHGGFLLYFGFASLFCQVFRFCGKELKLSGEVANKYDNYRKLSEKIPYMTHTYEQHYLLT